MSYPLKKTIYNYDNSGDENDETDKDEVETTYQANSTDTDATHDTTIDSKIRKLIETSKRNKISWNKQKMIYKLIEFFLYLIGLMLTSTSLWMSIWLLFYPEYHRVNIHLELLDGILSTGSIIPTLPTFYFLIELLSFTLDLAKGFVLLKVFLVFRTASNANVIVNNNENTERSETHAVISNLRQRIVVRRKLKDMLPFLIGYETILNVLILTFVIFPKLFAVIYVDIKMEKILNTQQFTNETTNSILSFNFSSYVSAKNQLNTVPNLNEKYECCKFENYDDQSTVNGCVSDNGNTCLYTMGHYFLRMLVIMFFLTAIVKFVFQIIFIINLRYLLIHPLIKKRQILEKRLLKTFESYRKNKFEYKVQSIIEKNNLNLSKYVLNSPSLTSVSRASNAKSKTNDSDKLSNRINGSSLKKSNSKILNSEITMTKTDSVDADLSPKINLVPDKEHLPEFSWNVASKKVRNKYNKNENRIAGNINNDSYRKATHANNIEYIDEYVGTTSNQESSEQDESNTDSSRRSYFKLKSTEPRVENGSQKFYS